MLAFYFYCVHPNAPLGDSTYHAGLVVSPVQLKSKGDLSCRNSFPTKWSNCLRPNCCW